MVSSAEHDEIWLDVDISDLQRRRRKATSSADSMRRKTRRRGQRAGDVRMIENKSISIMTSTALDFDLYHGNDIPAALRYSTR